MIRLLVVDDSVFAYKEICLTLELIDVEIVGHAKTGEEAVCMYTQLKPDVVTLDIVLPGIDGIEAAKQILTQDPDAASKIIIMSSLFDTDVLQEAEELGITHYASKPMNRETFIDTVLSYA